MSTKEYSIKQKLKLMKLDMDRHFYNLLAQRLLQYGHKKKHRGLYLLSLVLTNPMLLDGGNSHATNSNPCL